MKMEKINILLSVLNTRFVKSVTSVGEADEKLKSTGNEENSHILGVAHPVCLHSV